MCIDVPPGTEAARHRPRRSAALIVAACNAVASRRQALSSTMSLCATASLCVVGITTAMWPPGLALVDLSVKSCHNSRHSISTTPSSAPGQPQSTPLNPVNPGQTCDAAAAHRRHRIPPPRCVPTLTGPPRRVAEPGPRAPQRGGGGACSESNVSVDQSVVTP